jgi:adenylate cyclase
MVHEGIRNKLAVDFDDLGERSLKNIADPVRVYGLQARSEVALSDQATSAESIFRRPAVAVLPFENLGGDPDQEYFADGLTEDIITSLSMWKSFPVIARNSTFAYKGSSPDIRTVGKALGARYVIEGSVRKAGDRVRVTAQLINAETGHHVWAERFDRGLADIFALQDELTGRIAATIAPELERFEHQRAVATRVRDLDAWDCVYRGMAHLYEFTPEGNARAREMFARAIELDPSYGEAYSGTAGSYHRDLQFGVAGDRQETVRKGLEAARRGVALDSADPNAHVMLGIMFHWVPDHDSARAEFERAIQINPNCARALISLGHALALSGHPDEGIAFLEKGIQLNPQDPRNHSYFSFMARAYLTAHRYDDATAWARKAVQWNRDAPEPRVILATSLGHAGELEEARAELAECERIRPGYAASADNWHLYKFREDQEHFLDGLRKTGWEG